VTVNLKREHKVNSRVGNEGWNRQEKMRESNKNLVSCERANVRTRPPWCGVCGLPLLSVFNGSTTKNAVCDAGTLGLLQLVTHSCNPKIPNCRTVPIQTASDIELLVLEALREIPEGEEIIINNDAEASTSSKKMALRSPMTTSSCRRQLVSLVLRCEQNQYLHKCC
jgi:hypothetical protein